MTISRTLYGKYGRIRIFGENEEMKEGYCPKLKKLFVAWCQLVEEGKTPIYDYDVYLRAHPNADESTARKNAYKNMKQLRDVMEFKDYLVLYQGTPADFVRRFQENAKATKPFIKPNGTVEYIPDNSARNTANKDYADYVKQQTGDNLEEETEGIIFTRRNEEEEGAENGNENK